MSSTSSPAIPDGISRRRFVQGLLGFSVVATIAGAIVPVIGYLWPPAQRTASGGGRVSVGAVKDLPVGQAKILPVNDKPVIVVNTSTGGIKAFSAICTHLGCVVEWNQGKQIIQCPCHDGRFNPSTGAVISGPPPTPLAPVLVMVDHDQIFLGGT